MTDDPAASPWPARLDPERAKALTPDGVRAAYEACRNGITAENQLVSYRLTWALTLSGGFLTAESFMTGILLSNKDGLMVAAAEWISLLTVILSAIAAWFCRRTRRGVKGALDQIDYLRDWLEVLAPRLKEMGLPRPHGSPGSFRQGRDTGQLITFVLFTLWTLIATSACGWLIYLLATEGVRPPRLIGAVMGLVITAAVVVSSHRDGRGR